MPHQSEVARLALCERAATRGGLDGAWWPTTTDLGRELPDLLAVFGSWIGPVRRVVYDPSMWRPAPSRIIRGSTLISVDPYRLRARDTIYLKGTHSRNAVLFVVEPSNSAVAVRRLLRMVSDSTQPISVAALRRLLHPETYGADSALTRTVP